MDNIGVRYLLGNIALLQGDYKAAMKEYLKGAPNSLDCHPNAWYQAALIAFRGGTMWRPAPTCGGALPRTPTLQRG